MSHRANHSREMAATMAAAHGVLLARPRAVGDAIRNEVQTIVMNTAGMRVMM